ncbi:MAG: Uma2 family endonuclease [Verrucomicrobiales bacterium]
MTPPPSTKFETDRAGRIIYPIDNGEPLSNDTEHLKWITFVKNGLEDWYGDRADVFVAADLLWYPVEGRPDISKAPDVMVVLDHRAGERLSYKQWEENGRPPNVVFEFISKSNSADEMIDKLEFYSEMGCDEFFIYDYRRGSFHAFRRNGCPSLVQKPADPDGTWLSRSLGMTFGLDAHGRLWVRRPDGKLMESQRELARRADAEARRAEAEARRADEEAERADRLAAKLRALGVDPESE